MSLDIQGTQKKEPMGAKWRGGREAKEKRLAMPESVKMTLKQLLKITTLAHYQVSQHWAHLILILTSQNQKVKPKRLETALHGRCDYK